MASQLAPKNEPTTHFTSACANYLLWVQQLWLATSQSLKCSTRRELRTCNLLSSQQSPAFPSILPPRKFCPNVSFQHFTGICQTQCVNSTQLSKVVKGYIPAQFKAYKTQFSHLLNKDHDHISLIKSIVSVK